MGTDRRLRLFYMDMFHGHKPLAQIVGRQLERLGFDVVVDGLSAQDWAKTVREERDFDLIIQGGSMSPDPEITRTKYTTEGKNNASGHQNSDVDEAYEAARRAITQDERGHHYKRLQSIWARDTQWVPLFWYGTYYPRSTKFFGWADQLGYSIPWWHWGRIRPVESGE